MEGIEVCADTLRWCKVLDCAGAGLEGCVFGRFGSAFGGVGGWYGVHSGVGGVVLYPVADGICDATQVVCDRHF